MLVFSSVHFRGGCDQRTSLGMAKIEQYGPHTHETAQRAAAEGEKRTELMSQRSSWIEAPEDRCWASVPFTSEEAVISAQAWGWPKVNIMVLTPMKQPKARLVRVRNEPN